MGPSPTCPTFAIDVSAQGGEIADVHIERWWTGIRINAFPLSSPSVVSTSGLVIKNIHGCALGGSGSSCSSPLLLHDLIEFDRSLGTTETQFGAVLSGLRVEQSGTSNTTTVRIVPLSSPVCYDDLSLALVAISNGNTPVYNTSVGSGTCY